MANDVGADFYPLLVEGVAEGGCVRGIGFVDGREFPMMAVWVESGEWFGIGPLNSVEVDVCREVD